MSRKTALPEYYVMLCARRYAEMAKKLVVAVKEDERTQTKNRLTYILESGLIEFKRESERRLGAYDGLRRVEQRTRQGRRVANV